jgi:hypothetical protein
VVGSTLGVSNDWAHFTGKHLNFPNVLFVCQICTQILWKYVKFEAKNGHFSVVLYIHGVIHNNYITSIYLMLYDDLRDVY